jgi:hypothetical protein
MSRRRGDVSEPPRRLPPDEDDRESWQKPRRRGSRFVWIIAIIVVAVLAAVVASIIFKRATLMVTPKSQTVTLPQSLMATLDAPIGQLPFETVTTTNVGNRTVPASGESKVERRASGTLTILNTYSTASQRLIKNTRFEAPDGKIYRIDTSVEVPGGVKKADGTLTPGTVDVVVSADSPGDSYNRTSLDTFTIPGFKGDPRYTKITAKAKTAIQGGFVGTEKTVADADLAAAKTAIQTELASTLSNALSSATPAGYILLPQSVAYTYEELPRGGDASAAIISLRGTATAAIVHEADLAAAVARATKVDGYEGEALRFADPKKLQLTAKATATPGVTSLLIGFSGDTTLIWEVDASALKAALVGAPINDLSTILSRFKPAVVDAKASVRPFWESRFPEDPWLIDVEVKDPAAK